MDTYAISSVRGVIYEASDGSISIRDAEYLDNRSGRWLPVSRANPTLSVTLPGSTIIAKENRVINSDGLVKGDFVRVMTTELIDPPEPGATLFGIIVRVER